MRNLSLMVFLLAALTVTPRSVPAQRPPNIAPMHVHHVHLNSLNPAAAAAYYPKAFPISANKTAFNGYYTWFAMIMNSVRTPPFTPLPEMPTLAAFPRK